MKVFLVDDHPMVRSGLWNLIEAEDDLEVCGEAEDVPSALEEIGRTAPDVVLVDISLKGRSGLELVKILHGATPRLPILMVSTRDENVYAWVSLRAGALGYVMKHDTADSILRAVRQVIAGRMWVSPRVAPRRAGWVEGQAGSCTASPEARLTDRELEVFTLTGQGRTPAEISERLSQSLDNVGVYQQRIREKLGLRGRTEIHSCAARWLERGGGH